VSGDTVVNNPAGITNLMAYALGANPNTATVGALPVGGTASVSGSKYLDLNFTQNSAATDITYTVQGSPDLNTWSTISSFSGGEWSPSANVAETSGTTTVRDTNSMTSGTKRFLRLEITH